MPADQPPGPPSEPLSGEDRKIVVLARGARLRAHAPHSGRPQGAAVRDTDGRTYAAATVENADARLGVTAVQAAVAAAASSGVRAFEAVALVDEDPVLSDDDAAVVAEFGGAPVLLATPDGTVVARVPVG